MNRVSEFAADFGIYLLTVAGVFLARYVPLLKEDSAIVINWSWARLILSAVVAFVVTAGLDSGGDRAGKRANWVRRAAHALAQGFMWHQLIGG